MNARSSSGSGHRPLKAGTHSSNLARVIDQLHFDTSFLAKVRWTLKTTNYAPSSNWYRIGDLQSPDASSSLAGVIMESPNSY